MKHRITVPPRTRLVTLSLCACAGVSSFLVHAQGVLTVTPGRTLATAAGTGLVGFAGDSGLASSAALASPSALAYDPSGNLYIADAQNHVVREVLTSGTITTIAGTGVAGFGGDNGPAITAFLDTPTGIAIDSAGDLYIADSHNHRIREVINGVITTVAGTGTPGFSGDGGPATSAALFLPSALAFDGSGNLYIADTNNQRIRMLSGTTITTFAGNGEELYAGDGGSAISASLDLPTGVAVDSNGNVYIADRHNHRVRMVDASGLISTVAGTGPVTFSGAFSGDGTSPTSAALAKPTGVFLDASGSLFIADSNNQRVRQVSNGTIATIAGTGEQGFAGDNGPATSAVLDGPRYVFTDTNGTLVIADTRNQRLRAAPLPTLSFPVQTIGTAGPSQAITLANTGTAAITLSPISFTGAFIAVEGGTCAAPITLAAGADCSQNVAYMPVATAASTGSVDVTGPGLLPASIQLAGSGGTRPAPIATTLVVTSSIAAPLVGQSITFTATLQHMGTGIPTGAITFYDGLTPLDPAQSLSSTGTATFTTTTLAAGTHTITAAYPGDASFAGSTSAALTQVVADFTFTLGTTTPPTQTVTPGQPATFGFVVQPISTSFNLPVVLSATGLPPGASVTFTPTTLVLGSAPATFTMTIQTAANAALLHRPGAYGGTMAIALLLLPVSARFRRRTRGLRPYLVGVALLFGVVAAGAMTGCSNGTGFFGQSQKTYSVDVVATSTGTGGAKVQHVASVTLTVQ